MQGAITILPGSVLRGTLLQPSVHRTWSHVLADKKARRRALSVRARSGRQQTRLATRITTIPRRLDFYFADNPGRQALWSGISFGAGYYAANTVALSFGALAINDVVAAALTVGFCEACSLAYYGAANPGTKLMLLNSFKIGIITANIADAFKLGG